MTRVLTAAEVAKRAAIRAHKREVPSISTRELARVHHTSLRVVADALAGNASRWDMLLSRTVVNKFPSVVAPAMPPEALVPRDYQLKAARASVLRNTLLVLPTGLGKTVVALLHVRAILSPVPAGATATCIVMAPTKALLVQHRDLFQRHLAIPDAALAIVDGETTPDNRRVFYKSLVGKRVVLFATPQTVLHDLEKGRLPRERVVDLIITSTIFRKECSRTNTAQKIIQRALKRPRRVKLTK
ncbi:MAG: DEAD/DEAH box helicase [Candidatus Sigynarchaeota archaeon]